MLVEREPVTVVVSEKGWVRALRGHVADLSAVAFKTDDALQFRFRRDHVEMLFFATNGKFYTLDASKLPGGRGHGEPIRLFIDMEQDAGIVAAFRHQGGRKFLIASTEGQGFVVPEDECLANTRKGKQVLNVKAPDKAVAIALVEGDLVAVIGENRKMMVFPLNQVPEMTRGAACGCSATRMASCRDITTFEVEGRRPDLDRQRRPRPGHAAEGAGGLARQSRRCRPRQAGPLPEEQQVREGIG